MVHPTVGLPLLLGSVALTSLAVHTAVMTHTTWMGNYWSGSARVKVSEGAAIPDAPKPAAFSMTVTPAPTTAGSGQQASFVITVAPAPTSGPVTTASADAASSDPGSRPVVGTPAQASSAN